jgi:anti-sigma regulatory factor (Ser/Thr protein kinase)
VRLQADASAPSRARRYVASHCRKLPADTLDVVRLLTSELVTNAIVHGAGDALMDIEINGDVVIVGVRDHGEGTVGPASRFSWPETGHGLTLVEQLSERWGVEPADETPGKRVWFQLRWRRR